MRYPRGSEWARWDLHVHSPDSLVQHYGEGGGDPWENFLTDLESLPSEFRVIGLNDYLFLDGYRRVLEERAKGRLQNLDLILPVVELRLSHFGGTASALSRVNLHVIFSNELPADVIQTQFINGLACDLSLVPQGTNAIDWGSIPTRESLQLLGSKIRASSPAVDLGTSDLMLGFNNYNVTLETVLSRLNNPTLLHRYFLAVGKVEWADIKWTAQSIGDKKNLINRPQFVFTAAATPAAFNSARAQLAEAKVNTRLLDCSDAHYRSNSSNHNRIGNSLTWINAVPTFEGLRHAYHEYESRVFVGDLPKKLQSVKSDPTRYMKSLKVEKLTDAVARPEFTVDFELNHGFIAIVGNKGRGKSALTDVVGLLSACRRSRHYSFLTTARFKDPRSNLAAAHQGHLTWVTGQTTSLGLDQEAATQLPELVQYLPQSYLESVCNEGPGADQQFSAELGSVIFSHVRESDRLGASSLSELVDIRTSAIRRTIDLLRAEVAEIAGAIARVEQQVDPGLKRSVQAELVAKQREYEAHQLNRPVEVLAPAEPSSAEAGEARGRIEDVRNRIASLELRLGQQRQIALDSALKLEKANELKQEMENLNYQVDLALTRMAPLIEELELDAASLVVYETHIEAIDELVVRFTEAKDSAELDLSGASDDTTGARILEARELLGELEAELEAPERAHQAYLTRLDAWEREGREIVGSAGSPGTLENLEHRLREIDSAPQQLEQMKQALLKKSMEIHSRILDISAIYAELYEPVQNFIDEHEVARDRFSLSFEVTIIERGLAERFFSLLNRKVNGSYSGTDEGDARLAEQIARTDFNSPEDVSAFLQEVDDSLHYDRRPGRGGEARLLSDQVRTAVSPDNIYKAIFGLEYLVPEFWLRSDDKPISRLSPGQRGTLLLLFYLLVDQGRRPILLDQPEENLDNETVHDLLVPAIAEAKRHRQVMVVTHNANLAVVGDADQIIVAEGDDERFEYITGAIEDPVINARLVSILEGTWPAFKNRDDKYVPTSLLVEPARGPELGDAVVET